MFKKCKVVMLPTNEKAECRVGYYKDILSLFKSKHPRGKKELSIQRSMNGIEVRNQQHLYIISNEEIKEGDYMIFDNIRLERQFNWKDKTNCLKIIASTNILLNLPSPSQSFIDKYISEYNKGNIITDIMVEYELDMSLEEDAIKFPILKVSKDNTITIKRIKDSWNREELISKVNEAIGEAISYPEKFVTGICLDSTKTNTWIENNL